MGCSDGSKPYFRTPTNVTITRPTWHQFMLYFQIFDTLKFHYNNIVHNLYPHLSQIVFSWFYFLPVLNKLYNICVSSFGGNKSHDLIRVDFRKRSLRSSYPRGKKIIYYNISCLQIWKTLKYIVLVRHGYDSAALMTNRFR